MCVRAREERGRTREELAGGANICCLGVYFVSTIVSFMFLVRSLNRETRGEKRVKGYTLAPLAGKLVAREE